MTDPRVIAALDQMEAATRDNEPLTEACSRFVVDCCDFIDAYAEAGVPLHHALGAMASSVSLVGFLAAGGDVE